MLFILIFPIIPFLLATETPYDNALNINESQVNPDLKSCVFEVTEHFVLHKDDTSARMPLSSSHIFKSILDHLDYLVKH